LPEETRGPDVAAPGKPYLIHGVLAVGAGVWGLMAWTHVRSLNARIIEVKAALQASSSTRSSGDDRAYQAWIEPVPAGAVLATIATLAPASISFHSLVLDYPRPDRLGARAPAITMQIQGTSSDGADLARFIDSLISDSRFRKVRMTGGSPEQAQDDLRFRIDLEVPLSLTTPAPRARRAE